jgi:hypothetical protein
LARLPPLELPPKAPPLLLRELELGGTERLPTLSPPLLRLALLGLLVLELLGLGREAELVCGRFAPLPLRCCDWAPACRDESESPRAVPPNLSAVARFAYGAPPRWLASCCHLLVLPARLPLMFVFLLMLLLRTKLLLTLMSMSLLPQPQP